MSKTSVKPRKSATASETLPAVTEDASLHELFLDGIKDIYWAENQLVKALPVMEAAASNAELALAVSNHLEVTRNQVTRLEEIFALLNEKVQARKCDAMEGLTKEGEAVIEDTEEGTVARDTGVIMAARKVEHYEIAAYTGLHALAIKLGLTEAAALLEQSLAEEQESDQTLATLSDSL